MRATLQRIIRSRRGTRQRQTSRALADREITNVKAAFAADQIDAETLEAEIELWDQVADCDLCGPVLCSAHYDRFYQSGA